MQFKLIFILRIIKMNRILDKRPESFPPARHDTQTTPTTGLSPECSLALG